VAFGFILTPLFRELQEEKTNSVTVGHAGCHSTCSKLSIAALEEMFGEKVGKSRTVAL